jgi:hypothetical protein
MRAIGFRDRCAFTDPRRFLALDVGASFGVTLSGDPT